MLKTALRPLAGAIKPGVSTVGTTAGNAVGQRTLAAPGGLTSLAQQRITSTAAQQTPRQGNALLNAMKEHAGDAVGGFVQSAVNDLSGIKASASPSPGGVLGAQAYKATTIHPQAQQAKLAVQTAGEILHDSMLNQLKGFGSNGN